jgi:hypothetical protein
VGKHVIPDTPLAGTTQLPRFAREQPFIGFRGALLQKFGYFVAAGGGTRVACRYRPFDMRQQGSLAE